ncbi:MAG: hypothetical protein GF309_07000 [Candidatus Lokiarchaeota archaeon]|nr:hypothetical protein [Candidatus Lokiarchaeota archaeon]
MARIHVCSTARPYIWTLSAHRVFGCRSVVATIPHLGEDIWGFLSRIVSNRQAEEVERKWVFLIHFWWAAWSHTGLKAALSARRID